MRFLFVLIICLPTYVSAECTERGSTSQCRQSYETHRFEAICERSNGDIYNGSVNCQFQPTGYGEYFFKKGGSLKGSWDNGELFGEGSRIFADGSSYEGFFSGGEPDGLGQKIFANGDNFSGNFVNGQMHGMGIYTFIDGSFREGEWKKDKLHGKAKYFRFIGVTEEQWENGLLIEEMELGQVFLDAQGKRLPPRLMTIDEKEQVNIMTNRFNKTQFEIAKERRLEAIRREHKIAEYLYDWAFHKCIVDNLPRGAKKALQTSVLSICQEEVEDSKFFTRIEDPMKLPTSWSSRLVR